MLAVFGLGNPGKDYEGTRHNVGFLVVDRLGKVVGAGSWRRRFNARLAEAQAPAGKLLLVKPQTFMNDSGRSVAAAMAWTGLAPGEVIVVCDDLNLDFGRIRIRRGGSSGGHKGLASIAQALGTHEFPRLRIGIGRPAGGEAIDYVLGRFTAGERAALTDVIDTAAQAVLCWATDGIDVCMNRFN